MQVQNAIKKLEKAGFTVQENSGRFVARNSGHRQIEFLRNGRSEEITCIHTRKIGEQDDSMTDYFAGIWHDNITQAIKFCN